MIREQKVFALIREILSKKKKKIHLTFNLLYPLAFKTSLNSVYVGFLWMLLLVAYGQRDPNAYYLTQHIRQSFSNGISESMEQKDIFNWVKTSLLNNLFGQYPGILQLCPSDKNNLSVRPLDLSEFPLHSQASLLMETQNLLATLVSVRSG